MATDAVPAHWFQGGLALMVLSAGTAYAQRWALHHRSRLRWAAAWVLGTAAIAGLLVFSAVARGDLLALFSRPGGPGAGTGDLATVLMRINLVTCLMATALIPAMAWWDRLATFGARDAARAAARLSIPAAVTLLLIGLFVDTLPAGDPAAPAAGPPAIDPWTWPIVLALFVVVGLNAAGWARALAQRGLDRVAAVLMAVVPTLVAAGVSLWLLTEAVARLNLPASTPRDLLGLSAPAADAAPLLARWLAAYLGAVLVMGVSGAVGLRLGAAPREPMEPLHLPHAVGEAAERPLADATGRALGALLARGMEPMLGHPLAGVERPPVTFPERRHLRWLFIAWALSTLYLALAPFSYDGLTLAAVLERSQDAADAAAPPPASTLMGQLLLFVPLGFIGLGAATLDRQTRWPVALALPVMVISVFCWALLIEFVQLWFPPRRSTVSDALAAAMAATAGMGLWLLVGRRLIDRLRELLREIESAQGRQRLMRWLAALLLLYALVPLRLEHSVAITAGGSVPAARAPQALWTFVAGWLRDLLLFVPLGAVLAMGWEWPRTRPRRRALGHAAGYAAAVALAVALLRGLVEPSGVLLSAVAMAVGGLVGAAAARAWVAVDGTVLFGWEIRYRGRMQWAILFCVLYGLLLAALLWHPFNFTADPIVFNEQVQRFASPPLANYYPRGAAASLLSLLHYVMLLAPVGVALRWATGEHLLRPLLGWSLVASFALVIGLVIEAGQAATLPEPMSPLISAAAAPAPSSVAVEAVAPVPDVTDLLAYVAGALLGWTVTGLFLSRDH